MNVLYVWNLPSDTRVEELGELFENYGNIINIQLNANLGKAKIIYENPGSIEEAIFQLNGVTFGGRILEITRTDLSASNSFEEDMRQQSIYINNLHHRIREQDLRNLFGEYGNILSIALGNSSAVIIYDNDESGDQAIENLNGRELNGRRLEIMTLFSGQGTDSLEGVFSLLEEEPPSPVRRNNSNNDDLIKQSYETLLKQLHNIPVILPEFLIVNGLSVNFISFEQVSEMLNRNEIERYIIEPILQPFAGFRNRILTMFHKDGTTYLVKGIVNNNQIFPPI